MAFKNTLIKCITAVLCVIAISVTACLGTGKYCDAKIEAAKLSGTASSGADSTPADGTIADDGSTVDPADPGTDVTDPSGETPADDTTPTDGTTAAPVVNGTTAKSSASSSSTSSSAPKTTAQIISAYNAATAKVVSSKAGYSKARVTDNENLNAPITLKTFKGLIYKFMGIGSDNKYTENVVKGKWGDNPYILASKLTTSDVTSANCVSSNGVYTITMKLKNGSSFASKAKPTTAANTALDKSGICVGTQDKNRFDHKTASVMYDAIDNTYAGVEISESYSNAVVKATVNAKTGQLTSLKVEWNCSVKMSKILGATASATAISHVSYSSFKY